MAYRLIKGEFIVFNAAAPPPDRNPTATPSSSIQTIPRSSSRCPYRRPPDVNASGQINVRSFRPLPSFPSRLEHAEPHPLPGHVLSRGLDPNGRIVAFAYGGDTSEVDGADLFVDEARVDASVNARVNRDDEFHGRGLRGSLRPRGTSS